jgi:hypothetical protein
MDNNTPRLQEKEEGQWSGSQSSVPKKVKVSERVISII